MSKGTAWRASAAPTKIFTKLKNRKVTDSSPKCTRIENRTLNFTNFPGLIPADLIHWGLCPDFREKEGEGIGRNGQEGMRDREGRGDLALAP